MILEVDTRIRVRDLDLLDAADIVRLADNPKVAATLRDRFPHPYQLQDALEFIVSLDRGESEAAFAIEVSGQCAGVVGFMPGQDVYRYSAEVGYWLGEEFWGQGIMTKVLVAFSEWIFANHDFRRLFAGVFSSNPASARVLEKAGYVREGVMRQHVTKGGEVLDEWHYALCGADPAQPPISSATK